MTNAEARFSKSLRPRKSEGSLGRTAQDVHLDSHTAPELHAAGPVGKFLTLSAIKISANQKEKGRQKTKTKKRLKGHGPEHAHWCEPVWPSGKALQAGKRKGIGSIARRLSFLFKKVVVCGHCLETLYITSCWNIKMALIAAHLNLTQKSFWCWQCSDRYIISLFPHTPSPPPPPPPVP